MNENPLNFSRRSALRLLAGFASATATVVTTLAATTGGAAAAQARTLSSPPLDGELRFDEKALAAAADDFGHIVRRTPEGVLLPASDKDVAATIRWANEVGRKVAAQGECHSVYGRC